MSTRYSAWLIVVLGCVMVVGAMLSSCSPDTSAPELQENTIAPDDRPAPDSVPTLVAMDLVPFEDHECLNCHTDQELLQEITPEEEETEELSEGPG